MSDVFIKEDQSPPEMVFDETPPPEYAARMRQKRWNQVRMMWEQRRWLVRVAAIGLVLSTLVAFLIPSEYESTAKLMPPEQRSSAAASILNFMSMSGGSGTGGNNNIGGIAGQLLGGKDTGDLLMGVLKSATLEDRVIDRFDLRKVYRTHRYGQARKRLEENTEVSQDRKSGIITYTVTDTDPQRATDISRAYINELNQLMSQLDNSSAHRERIFLEGRLLQVTAELETAEKVFSQYSSKSGAIDITEQGKAMVEAAAVLQGQLIAAESQLEGLRQIYATDNVRVRAAEAQVQELKQQLLKFAGKAGESTSAENADGSETSSLYPTIRQLPLIGVTYADLLRNLKIKEAVFEVLTKEHELAKAQEAGEAPSVAVLDPPSKPEGRAYPPRALIIIFGTLGAIVLGGLFLMARWRWREMDPNSPAKVFVREILVEERSSDTAT